jgi:hypothetical protein
LGDDILSGNSLSVVGLYQAVFGINPKYNRFYLAPHITNELAGTQLKYNYRGRQLIIDLEANRYIVTSNQFKISCKSDFGFYDNNNELLYFKNNADQASLHATIPSKEPFSIDIMKWEGDEMIYTQTYRGANQKKVVYQIDHLSPNTTYIITVNCNDCRQIKTNNEGKLVFEQKGSISQCQIIVALSL